MNKYLLKIHFYTGKPYSVEVDAESSVIAIRTFFEALPEFMKEKNIDTIKVHRIV